ncbi:uncharacterized protein LOC117224927 [Megalopta genalis]|uniref:uncharacterized protein LOC117224927 n=1 Tax=Megalopta genalis TaxID=115081 RepID=UPI003FD18969
MLELLTGQIAAQEKQFLGLTETVRDLVREKARLQDALQQKQMEFDVLERKFQSTIKQLDAETLERPEKSAEKIHRACQTEQIVTSTSCKRGLHEKSSKGAVSCQTQNLKIKSKEDLEEPSTDGTLLRELFFRKPCIDENGTLDIIPVLSDLDPCIQMKRSSSALFI